MYNMENNGTEPMENTIEAHCQHLLDDIVSLTIIDVAVYFILFITMRWIENALESRYLFLRAMVLQFLLSYFLDKICPKYINLILSYMYIFACKSILLKSIPKIGFYLVSRSRGKIVFCVSVAVCLFIPASFFLKSYVVDNSNIMYLAFLGLFVRHSNIESCPVETPDQDEIIDIKEIKLTIDELESLIQKLCQCTREEGDDIDDYMIGYEEFSSLFEDLEPGLDEVFEAFSIFDQDRDGFFDARDLQVVLINLGLGEDADLNECRHMIDQHDRGGGGKISLSDFCRILEISLI